MLVSMSAKFLARMPSFIPLLRDAFLLLKRNDPLRLASSAAFFALFSLPPILILLISVLGTLFSNALITGELFDRLSSLVGQNVASQVELILTNFLDLQGNGWAAALSFLFLTFVATTLFSVIQNSLNQIWNIRLRGQQHVQQAVHNRFRALLIIFSSGLLFLASLVMETVFVFMNDHYTLVNADFQLGLFRVLNRLVALVIEMAWFAIILRFLPYGKMPLRPVLVGAAVTAFLFLIGKLIMVQLLVKSDLSSFYATSGSVVVLLLFIFYSALIFFFGACYTRVYARQVGQGLTLKSFATFYEERETNQQPF